MVQPSIYLTVKVDNGRIHYLQNWNNNSVISFLLSKFAMKIAKL